MASKYDAGKIADKPKRAEQSHSTASASAAAPAPLQHVISQLPLHPPSSSGATAAAAHGQTTLSQQGASHARSWGQPARGGHRAQGGRRPKQKQYVVATAGDHIVLPFKAARSPYPLEDMQSLPTLFGGTVERNSNAAQTAAEEVQEESQGRLVMSETMSSHSIYNVQEPNGDTYHVATADVRERTADERAQWLQHRDMAMPKYREMAGYFSLHPNHFADEIAQHVRSGNDHPSAQVHAAVADKVYDQFRAHVAEKHDDPEYRAIHDDLEANPERKAQWRNRHTTKALTRFIVNNSTFNRQGHGVAASLTSAPAETASAAAPGKTTGD